MPLGIAMGVIVDRDELRHERVGWRCSLMILIGALAGFFVVPMNALLQHRGHILMGAGHSIAVQNFNENRRSWSCSALYALLIWANLSIYR